MEGPLWARKRSNVSAGTDANVTYSAGKIGNMGTYNGASREIAFGNDLDFERFGCETVGQVFHVIAQPFLQNYHIVFVFISMQFESVGGWPFGRLHFEFLLLALPQDDQSHGPTLFLL